MMLNMWAHFLNSYNRLRNPWRIIYPVHICSILKYLACFPFKQTARQNLIVAQDSNNNLNLGLLKGADSLELVIQPIRM